MLGICNTQDHGNHYWIAYGLLVMGQPYVSTLCVFTMDVQRKEVQKVYAPAEGSYSGVLYTGGGPHGGYYGEGDLFGGPYTGGYEVLYGG